MQWVKLELHFPSFFSYRRPDYSSQYALSVPLPAPSTIKLGAVATAIKTTGSVAEGKRVFYSMRDAEIRVIPPRQIAINSVLIKRFKKKKNPTEFESFESTFGVREYAFTSEDINLFIGCKDTDKVISYLKMLRYVGSGDSIVYVKNIKYIEKPPENSIKPISNREFAELTDSLENCVVYPVKDLSKSAKFEHINPYESKSSKKVFEQKYYLIKAKVKKGKNWKILEI